MKVWINGCFDVLHYGHFRLINYARSYGGKLIIGIDYMKENHPDYKGEDFLDWGEDGLTKMAGRDGWDDNTVHTEGEIG